MNILPRFARNVKSGVFNLTTKKGYTTPSATPANPPSSPSPPSFESNNKVALTKAQKYMCVWAKRYPSFNEVPDLVTPDLLRKVRSIIRIKSANYTMVIILLGCVGMVISGKRARDRGETIMQRNLEWHEKYSEGKEDVKNLGLFGK